MNLPPNTRSAFALNVDASTLRSSSAVVTRGESGDGKAFAGLLQSQALRLGRADGAAAALDTREANSRTPNGAARPRASSGGAYDGSAFDVPEARREPTPQQAAPASRARPAATQDRNRQPPVRENTGPRTQAADNPDGSETESAEPRRAPAAAAERRDGPRPERRAAARDGLVPGRASAGAEAATADAAATEAAPATSDHDAAANDAAVPLPAGTPQNPPVLDWLARFGRGIAPSDGQAAGAEGLGSGAVAELASPTGRTGGPGDPAAPGAMRFDGREGTEAATGSSIGGSADASMSGAQAAMGQGIGAEGPWRIAARETPQAGAAPEGMASAAEPGAVIDALRSDAPIGSPLAPASPPAAATAAAPVQAAIAAPLASPDFAAALAARLTTLASEGVQHAQLQLNPAEMGPIAVQIVVDGTQAQIDFSAAHAETRDALAASLPSLAASLHAAGLTLSGGGVSDQRHERPSGDGAPSRPTPQLGDAAGSGGDGPPLAARTARGLLDLYA